MADAADPNDLRFMQAALNLARRGLGHVWPNPAVGCFLARDGLVVGRGWTQPGGRPHAETEALRRAGDLARGATAYVTLEPCSHHGKTGPCADAMIAAGVARVVIACEDPDPRVSGGGVARLRQAGVAVTLGVCETEAKRLNEGFFRRVLDRRPLYSLKLATTLDGRIATHTGASRWITGPVARSWGHGLRATHDAIMIGIGTALADDPELTCRLAGLEDRSPVRVVVDSRLRLPLTSRLVRSASRVPTWVVTRPDADGDRSRAFEDCGLEVLTIPPDDTGSPNLSLLGHALADRGLTRVLSEGGARLAASLMRADLVDRLEWFRAPSVIGGDGIPAVRAYGVDALGDSAAFTRVEARKAGDDLWESYVRRGG
ncbi:MAG TPA: bifunctional diaminohydroxyphosphoribosylaminopyrimidine deaminase/5-amino-6-(5-phosphoribosylamino)uracil reductase RibD [Azospirillaceae bacterium]|nr:bifunctional diaminohydroxyphosphoribosylaminopyrimidine deaminase/5-amino-6-(5-phosphoribosylamino)uracil reductase RibD [Azospirillaceae bacterium]